MFGIYANKEPYTFIWGDKGIHKNYRVAFRAPMAAKRLVEGYYEIERPLDKYITLAYPVPYDTNFVRVDDVVLTNPDTPELPTDGPTDAEIGRVIRWLFRGKE